MNDGRQKAQEEAVQEEDMKKRSDDDNWYEKNAKQKGVTVDTKERC